jgi:hypothetical protein
LAASLGCTHRPAVAPASGKVLYNGEPLPYGAVVLQPPAGQFAGGAIQPDGTFRLSTFKEYDGAIIGPHKVKITCYAAQRPSAKSGRGDVALGESLIPAHYTLVESSRLTAEIKPEGNDDLLFELKGPKRTFPK